VLPTVAKMFARIFSAMGILDLRVLPPLRRRADSVSPLSLESFFPFDPYLLRNSHPYIAPLYTEWDDAGPPGSDAESGSEEASDDGVSAQQSGCGCCD
jgi:hypothetical protein